MDYLSFFIVWIMAHADPCAPVPRPTVTVTESRNKCEEPDRCTKWKKTVATTFYEGHRYTVLLINDGYAVQYFKDGKLAYDAPSLWVYTFDNPHTFGGQSAWCALPVLDGTDFSW